MGGPERHPEDPKDNRLAVHTEDHPLEYLEFEGDIPKGSYGAGSMRIWDRGTYEEHKFDGDKVEITFHGERLQGRYGLFPLKKVKGEPPGKDWMIHRMDPPSDPTRQPMPEQLKPMLARAGSLPRDDARLGVSRSSGTACARSPTPSPGGSASRAATATTSPPAIRSCARSTAR